MQANVAYIALGSNKEDRFNFLQKAISLINLDKNTEVLEVSSVYETKPFGITEQENFLNAVAKITTDFSPLELLTFLKKLEKVIGRKETARWGPREIDIDILFYNDLILNDEQLQIPHKGIVQRAFVLVPLNEIAPELFHPVLNKKVKELVTSGHQKEILRKLPEKII